MLTMQDHIKRVAAMSRRCSHGKTFDEPCIDCKLVLAREGLAWATQSVERYSAQIAELEAEKEALTIRGAEENDANDFWARGEHMPGVTR
jgi:hypothetical protein